MANDLDILHLLPSLSQFGGTPRKTLELARYSSFRHAIYAWHEWDMSANINEHAAVFAKHDIEVFREPHGAQILRHLIPLHRVLRQRRVKVVHAYFESGAALAALCKGIDSDVRVVLSLV